MTVHPLRPAGPGSEGYEDGSLHIRVKGVAVVHAARAETQSASRRAVARGEARLLTYAQAKLVGYAEPELPNVLLVTRRGERGA